MGKVRNFYEMIDCPSATQLEPIMKHFSESDTLCLDVKNFKNLLSDLLDNPNSSCKLSDLMVNELFNTFDKNNDGVIDMNEFISVSNIFIQPLLKPVTALLVIDVQNDFIDGSLSLKNCPAKQDGSDVIPVINSLLDKFQFDIVAYSLDYHPENHVSFVNNVNLFKLDEKNKPLEEISVFDTVVFEGPPKMSQKLWPTHCVENTWGSEIHKDLKVTKDSLSIYKGINPSVDSYSAFFDNMKLSKTDLDAELKKRKVTHVFICGLAFDYCVGYTAIDAAELGYAVVVLKDATRGTEDSNIKCMEERLKSLNCVLANSYEIESLMSGKDIRAEFAATLQSTLKET